MNAGTALVQVIRTIATALRKEILHPASFVAWVVSSVLLSITGPFGTYGNITFGERWAYWFIVVLLSHILAVLTRVSVRAIVPSMSYLRGDLIDPSYSPFFSHHGSIIARSTSQGAKIK